MLITKKRVLRRSSRAVTSPYRVHCEKVTANDELLLNIFDENDELNPIFTFRFSGNNIADHNSIHFHAKEIGSSWEVKFLEVQPD